MWNSRALFYFNIIEKKNLSQPLFIFVLSAENNEIT